MSFDVCDYYNFIWFYHDYFLYLHRGHHFGFMTDNKEVFINPYTDFGFKKLFGTEMNKDLLISFLNSLLSDKEEMITNIRYLNSERLGDAYGDRRSVFDVYCETESGSKFIVEMQKAEQKYFKDRSIYYATTPIREQAPKGQWDYRLEDVYSVSLLDFKFPAGEYPDNSYRHEVKLKDVEDNHVFYDKLTLIYLEMPKFNKVEEELVTMFEKWMYALRNLYRLLERPKALQDRIFGKLFEQAEIAKYSPSERSEYEESVKVYRDYINTVGTAHDRGVEEGYELGKAEGMELGKAKAQRETAKKMKVAGLALELISQVTGLTIEEITHL